MNKTVCCPKCSAANAVQAKFCAGCGVPLRKACSGCGKTIPVSARFCPLCGLDSAESQERAPLPPALTPIPAADAVVPKATAPEALRPEVPSADLEPAKANIASPIHQQEVEQEAAPAPEVKPEPAPEAITAPKSVPISQATLGMDQKPKRFGPMWIVGVVVGVLAIAGGLGAGWWLSREPIQTQQAVAIAPHVQPENTQSAQPVLQPAPVPEEMAPAPITGLAPPQQIELTPTETATRIFRDIERGDAEAVINSVQGDLAVLGGINPPGSTARERAKNAIIDAARDFQSHGGISSIAITPLKVSGNTALLLVNMALHDGKRSEKRWVFTKIGMEWKWLLGSEAERITRQFQEGKAEASSPSTPVSPQTQARYAPERTMEKPAPNQATLATAPPRQSIQSPTASQGTVPHSQPDSRPALSQPAPPSNAKPSMADKVDKLFRREIEKLERCRGKWGTTPECPQGNWNTEEGF